MKLTSGIATVGTHISDTFCHIGGTSAMAHTEQGPQVTSQLHWPKKAAAAICAGSSVGSRSNRFAREMPAQSLTAALNGLASVTTPTPPPGDRAWSSPRTASQKGSATPEPTHSICAALRVTRGCVCSCWPFLGQSCSPLGLGLPAILTFHPTGCWKSLLRQEPLDGTGA